MSKRRDQTELLTDMATASRAAAPPRRRAAGPPRSELGGVSDSCWLLSSCVPHVFLFFICFHMFPHLNKHQQAAWHHEFAGIRSWWIEDSHAEARHYLFLGAISMAISYWCWRNGDLDLKPRRSEWGPVVILWWFGLWCDSDVPSRCYDILSDHLHGQMN